jgi:hypothetical protein
VSVADDMSGFCSRKFGRLRPEGSDAGGGSDGSDGRGDPAVSERRAELRGGGGGSGVSQRHFRRLRDRYELEGVQGIIDRRRSRASGRRAPARILRA